MMRNSQPIKNGHPSGTRRFYPKMFVFQSMKRSLYFIKRIVNGS